MGCKSPTKDETNTVIKNNPKTIFYDLYYLEKTQNRKGRKYSNIDSLGKIKRIEPYFEYIIRKRLFDSITISNLMNKAEADILLKYKIEISDSIKKRVLAYNVNKNRSVNNSFSTPIKFSDDKYIVFVETSHSLGGSNSVVFYSKNQTNKLELDSITLLGNYRGGGGLEE